MSWQTVEIAKPWYQRPRFWIAAGCAVCVLFLTLPLALRVWHGFSGRRHLARAVEASAKGDIRTAMFEARVALAYDGKSVEALRTIAKILESVGSPAALEYRHQLDSILPGDAENLLSMADDHLQAGNLPSAESALASLSPPQRQGAHFEGTSGGIALQKQDLASAEKHLAEAARLDPNQPRYQMTLAALRLNSREASTRAAARHSLDELSQLPAQRATALRILIDEAKQMNDYGRAISLAERLASDPKATMSDRLNRLATLHEARAGQLGTFDALGARRAFYVLLDQMWADSLRQPMDLYEMMNWMNEHELSFVVCERLPQISAELLAKPPVSVGAAEACSRTSAWGELRKQVEKASWPKAESLRLAYLARAYEMTGDAGKASAAWQEAMQQARGNVPALQALSARTDQWNWMQRGHEVLASLTERDDCPRWAIDRLWKDALQRGDAAQARKAAKLILHAEPKSAPARNRFLLLCLLTGDEAKTTPPLVESLYQENPNDLSVCVTYGLLLQQRGRASEAAKIMEKFPEADVRAPRIALYQGLFLAAGGQPDAAGEYLTLGATAPQLPEERALVDYLRLALETRRRDQAGDSAGAESSWKEALQTAGNRAEALDSLGRIALGWGWTERTKATVLKLAQMERCPAWGADLLWSATLAEGDSGQLYRAARLIQEQDAKNVDAHARFLLIALLTRHGFDSLEKSAEQLHQANPAHVEATLAHALALSQAGRATEGLKALTTLPEAQLTQPRVGLYRSLLLAQAGQAEEAAVALPKETGSFAYPDEQTMAALMTAACAAGREHQQGHAGAARQGWEKALLTAKLRPDWLELLGHLAVAWHWDDTAEETLWLLAGSASCPAWAAEFLWHAAEQRHDSAKLYEASKLVSAADPKSVAARNNVLYLALLTKREVETSARLAAALYQENSADPDITTTYGLSLFQTGKASQAVASMARLKPEQLQKSRAALFYGIFLKAAGQSQQADAFLRSGGEAAHLPEEQALLQAAHASS